MSLRIMVVDDEQGSQTLVKCLSEPLGHTVFAYDDAHKAGHRAEEQRFDVVFVGMGSPQMDGIELARRIRNSDPNRETTIVMLSATGGIDSLRTAFGEGANFVLTKPITARHLAPMLAAMDSDNWKGKRHSARLPLFTDVTCKWDAGQASLRSLNISEAGMLLQPAVDRAVGQEVALEFKLADAQAPLHIVARVARKEGTQSMGVEFVGLALEELNAIQLYVMGRLKGLTPRRKPTDIGTPRLGPR